MALSISPLTGALGAEVSGIELSQDLTRQQLAELRQAWQEQLVLVFRHQALQPADMVALARHFGDLHIHPFVAGIPEQPEVIEIIKEPKETNAWGGGWHSDVSFEDCPSLGSMLYAREIPPFGGDTLFANLELAYATLPKATRQRIDGLSAVHASGDAAEFYDDYRGMTPRKSSAHEATHPVVRTHPETGRKILFINLLFTKRIVGMAAGESDELLAELLAHATRPEFTCRVRWAADTLVMWDNRSVMHNAMADYFESRGNTGYRRVMQRVTIQGDRPQ